MSSILKALKKLEDQTVEENATLVWPDAIGTKKYDIHSKNRKKYTILIITPMIILSGIGGYIWLNRQNDGMQHMMTNDITMNTMALVKPGENIIPPHLIKDDLIIKRTEVSAPENIQNTTDSKLLTLETDDKPEKTDETQYPENAVERKEDVAGTAETGKAIGRKKLSPPKIEASSLKEVEDPRITLQAIAWAPEPENSFAVINNRIIREGNTVEGITVLQIGKEAVSFQEGSSKWKQKFRVK